MFFSLLKGSDLQQSPPSVALKGCKSEPLLGVIENCSLDTIVAPAPAHHPLMVKGVAPYMMLNGL